MQAMRETAASAAAAVRGTAGLAGHCSIDCQRPPWDGVFAAKLQIGLKFRRSRSDIPPNAPESLRTWSGWPAEG
jgi:hypothetical protein